jgi:hypothetical protein
MAPVSGHPASVLAVVRRYEAAGFRAWPAATVHYDGTWAIRLTAGLPAKRLNSINPLDPRDVDDLPERIMRAGRRFDAYGRPPMFRLSPLAGRALRDEHAVVAIDQGGGGHEKELTTHGAALGFG